MDIFDKNGLQTKTLEEIISELEAGFRKIYGEDIIISPESVDGQIIHIFAQSAAAIRENITFNLASFDIEQAEGSILDQRVALNGLIRKGGTYTRVNVDITVDRPLNLTGLDDTSGLVYTIKDNVGTQFVLEKSQNFPRAGTYNCVFRAKDIGDIRVGLNTLTVPETVIAGVISLNNSSSPIHQGGNEETDDQLRSRRRLSFEQRKLSQTDLLEKALWNTPLVTDVYVDENSSAGTVNSIPAHSLWIIVEGGADSDIGQVIYKNKSSGCGTKGEQVITIDRCNGRTVTYRFDRPEYLELHIKATVGYLGNGAVNFPALKEYIAKNLKYKLKQTATADDIISIIKKYNSNYYVENARISSNGQDWLQVLTPNSSKIKFAITETNIDLSKA